MPQYQYLCENCCCELEECRSIKKGPRKKCPECGAKEPAFNQVYSAPTLIVYDCPTTVGQVAEKNAKRVGKEKMALMADEYKNAKKEARLKLPAGAKKVEKQKNVPLPWWRSGEVDGLPKQEKQLDLKKVKNVRKFIQEGTM